MLYRTGDVDPRYKPVDFLPPFHEQLAFVYLGKKQDSASSVRNFLNKALVREKDISEISAITEKLCRTVQLDEFEDLIREHENILSHILGLPPVKQGLFQDYHAGDEPVLEYSFEGEQNEAFESRIRGYLRNISPDKKSVSSSQGHALMDDHPYASAQVSAGEGKHHRLTQGYYWE